MRAAWVAVLVATARPAVADDTNELRVVVGSGVGWTTRPVAVTRVEGFAIGHGLRGMREPDEVHDEWFAGVRTGLEAWSDGLVGGGGFSACFVAGARSGRWYSTLGVGATWIGTFLDERGEDHVMFAPHAAGALGIFTRRYVAELQLRAQRNLIAGVDNSTLYTVMLGFGRKVVTASYAARP